MKIICTLLSPSARELSASDSRKTGRARLPPGGPLEFLGRSDQQAAWQPEEGREAGRQAAGWQKVGWQRGRGAKGWMAGAGGQEGSGVPVALRRRPLDCHSTLSPRELLQDVTLCGSGVAFLLLGTHGGAAASSGPRQCCRLSRARRCQTEPSPGRPSRASGLPWVSAQS